MRSARSEQRPDLLRIVSALVCALVAAYWLGVAATTPGRVASANFELLTAALGAGSLLAMVSAAGVRTRLGLADGAFRAAAIGLALFALTHALLLYEWTRADSDRFLWIIRRLGVCASMGGGPGTLWVLVLSVVFALFAANYALRRGPTARALLVGLVIGAVLTLATAAAMFPDPTIYARVLGCL